MKRTQRRHLKENELAHTIVAARAFIDTNRRALGGIVALLVLLAVIAAGALIVRQRTQARGQDLLAAAMVTLNARVVPTTTAEQKPGELPAAATMGATGTYPTEEAKLRAALPKLKSAADAYPDSPAGITARYHYAAALAALGQSQDAIQAFDDVIKRGGDTLYGRMALMGKADTQTKAGQLDAAIAGWKGLAERKDVGLPEDAILLELGRAYQAKGNTEEARKTFNQLVEQHPTSPYVAEARSELDSLKG